MRRRPREPSEDALEGVGGGGGGGGAGAPSVGVLMELVAAVRCPDGRLIVLAYGLGRLRVGSAPVSLIPACCDPHWEVQPPHCAGL